MRRCYQTYLIWAGFYVSWLLFYHISQDQCRQRSLALTDGASPRGLRLRQRCLTTPPMQRLRSGYVGGGFLRFLRFLRILSLKEFFTAAVATPHQVRLGESLPLPDEASPWCWGYAPGACGYGITSLFPTLAAAASPQDGSLYTAAAPHPRNRSGA